MYPVQEWDTKKKSVMADLLRQKFDPKINPENYDKLMATGNKHLEEMNWWNDVFWGTDKDGKGENNLGKLLMEIREESK